MGLLDKFFGNADQTQALGLLGAHLMAGNAPGGFQAAQGLLADAPRRRMQEQLLQAQISETQAQAKEREQKMLLAQQAQANQQRLLHGDPGGVSAGAFSPSADGMGPTMPQGAAPQSGGIMALAEKYGIPPQAIQADIAWNGGKKVSELLAKHGARDMQVTNGYAYNKNDLGPGFMPFLSTSNTGQTSMGRIGPDGLPVVSAPTGAVDTFRAYNSAAAESKPIKVFNPATQREEYTSEAEVTRPRPQVPPAFRPQMPQSGPAPTGNFTGDPAAIMEAITQIRDPQERANAMAAFTEQAKRTQGFAQNGFAAGPSAGESAAAAGAKVRAEADARAGADRDATFAKGVVNSKDTLSYIGEARRLLKQGPTASGFGAIVDSGLGLAGASTKGGDVAAQLDTLSGWMVSNVPRMEGPQSNFDVQNYKTMAALVGDRTKPLSQRMAALDTLEKLQQKYASLNGGDSQPQAPAPPVPMKGMVRNGYRFKGGDPADRNSWEKQ